VCQPNGTFAAATNRQPTCEHVDLDQKFPLWSHRSASRNADVSKALTACPHGLRLLDLSQEQQPFAAEYSALDQLDHAGNTRKSRRRKQLDLSREAPRSSPYIIFFDDDVTTCERRTWLRSAFSNRAQLVYCVQLWIIYDRVAAAHGF
jgi:hypothetical protein